MKLKIKNNVEYMVHQPQCIMFEVVMFIYLEKYTQKIYLFFHKVIKYFII